MPAATPEERAAMDRAQAGLLQQLLAAERYAAEIKQRWVPTSAAGAALITINPVAGAAARLLRSPNDAQRAALKAIADERVRFNTWSTAWRGWALAGREPTLTGSRDYSVAFWLRIGGDMASALKVYSQGLYQADLFTIVTGAARQTADDFKPGSWPTWLQLAAGVAVVGGVFLIASNLTRALRG